MQGKRSGRRELTNRMTSFRKIKLVRRTFGTWHIKTRTHKLLGRVRAIMPTLRTKQDRDITRAKGNFKIVSQAVFDESAKRRLTTTVTTRRERRRRAGSRETNATKTRKPRSRHSNACFFPSCSPQHQQVSSNTLTTDT